MTTATDFRPAAESGALSPLPRSRALPSSFADGPAPTAEPYSGLDKSALRGVNLVEGVGRMAKVWGARASGPMVEGGLSVVRSVARPPTNAGPCAYAAATAGKLRMP